MKLFATVILTALLSFSLSAHAMTPEEKAELQVKYQRSIAKACRHRDSILKAAAEQKVSPHLMVGCLISEHTYLKTRTDDLVDLAALAGLYMDPSIGYAQIKLSTGRGLARTIYGDGFDQIDFETQNRLVIADLYLAPSAMKYMALLVRQIIGDYKAQGFDIAGSIGLVCSSYLIGNSSARARAHKQNGTLPELNWYGRFALKNEQVARNIVSGVACR